ncbi:MAG: oligoendopeptidase F, partial [Lachnospiraceae bacterium]|nr:oligoendopeptidase F [Lachnospiraceae bacterium]
MELQERSQMDPQYQWDLSSLYENDAAWEADFASAPTLIEKTAAFQGKLTGAAQVRACLDASTELTRRLDNLLTYAQLRQSEDTRSTKAQELWARGMALAVQAESRTSFVNPEILSLPEATLREIA